MKTTILLSSVALLGVFALATSCSKLSSADEEMADVVAADELKSGTIDPDCPYPTVPDSMVGTCCIYTGSTLAGTATDAEADGLLFMREEEKMARDVYTYLYGKYNVLVFKNIAKSEEAHLKAVLRLIAAYEIPDNSSNEAGVFTNVQLQELYNQLIAMGDLSVEDALKVGVLIEQADIADLESELGAIENASIKTVYTHLLAASNIHLKAFSWNLKLRGIVYP
ncbi:MAG: DUF2202 domain-containing protein [Prolixibacteraceae bacterium]|jgi:hypothetical protein